jgi:DNA (cytosine-5)-methyltransferase 1
VNGCYYNEIDPYCAAWLRNLIAAGHIAPGEVDERSVVDVRGDDLRGFTQVHLCAGIGVWSYALRLAGWSDDRSAWTGSFPCQPFSAAGRAGGFGDERHLWPHGARLIRELEPECFFGEQVASADGLAWLDFVCADLEAAGYAVGAVDTCAAGFGAPHIRQRLYFVGDSDGAGSFARRQTGATLGHRNSADAASGISFVGDSERAGLQEQRGERGTSSGQVRADEGQAAVGAGSSANALGDSGCTRSSEQRRRLEQSEGLAAPSATNGFWQDAHWLPCIDGKARATKPGLFPLVNGATNRVGKLRAAGNAIVAPQAAEFIAAYMSVRP